MNWIYLSRIKIGNFRTFGAFDISIPAAPGLTLLTGTNGLGKSSFFDALEWGLTGKVRRFEKYLRKGIPEGRYLTRRTAPHDSHSVSFRFTGGNEIEREFDHGPSESAVADLLKREDWPQIREIGTYLAFTHFLGQSSQERFTSRESTEQWKALRGPSGIDRLEDIRHALRGRATQLAFSRRIEQEQAIVEKIERQLADWQGWRVRLERLQQAGSAVGVLSPEELAKRNTNLEEELAALTAERPFFPQGANLSQSLTFLDGAIAAARQKLSERRSALNVLSTLPERYVSLVADARSDNVTITRTKQALSTANKLFAEAEAESKTRTEAANLQATITGNLESQIALVEAARLDCERRATLTGALEVANGEDKEIRTRLVEFQNQLSTTEEMLIKERSARTKVAEEQAAVELAERSLKNCQSLSILEATAYRSEKAADVAAEEAGRAQDQLHQLIPERDQIQGRLESALVELESAENRAGEIAAAVASISAHIRDDDTNCPVCNTPFKHGELRLLATSAAESVDSLLVARNSEVEQARAEASAKRHEVAALELVIQQASQARRAAEEDRRAVVAARSVTANLLHAEPNEELYRIAAERDQFAREALAKAEAQLHEVISLTASVGERRIALLADIEELKGRQADVSGRITLLELELRSCAERLAARNQEGVDLEELNLLLQTCQSQLSSARDSQVSLLAEVQRANTALGRQQESLSTAEKDFTQAEAARIAAETSVNAIEAQWSTAGLPLPVSEEMLETAKSEIVSGLGLLEEFTARQRILAHDNEATLLQKEIDEIKSAMISAASEAALEAPEIHEADLNEKLKLARAARELSSDAHVAVNRFTDGLKSEASEFSAQFLDPLNHLIDEFNQAVLSLPGETIHLRTVHRVDATRVEMNMRSRVRGGSVASESNIPPQIVLSEGQLAANGFSILCAASTAYQWSRWRALLLDDPLQHSDIIHMAAFVDLMRNMVEQQGYQLIMSSHDRAESDFIARKFDAADLPCSTITLTAPSINGVQFDGPIENAAAMCLRQRDRNQEIGASG